MIRAGAGADSGPGERSRDASAVRDVSECIVEVGRRRRAAAGCAAVVELADDVVLIPGLVDTHVHVNEPGRTHWEGFATATTAAGAGGVTTLLDMPLNSLPPTLSAAALDVKRAAAVEQCRIDVGFWGGAVPDNLADLPGLFAAGVFGVKCFLQDSGVPEFPPLDDAGLRRACELDRRPRRAARRARRGPGGARRRPGSARPGLRWRSSRPGRRTPRRSRSTGWSTQRPSRGVGCTSCTPVVGGGGRGDPAGQGVGGADHRRDLSALPDPGRRRRSRTGHPSSSAARRSADDDEQDALWAALVDGTIDIVVSDHSPAPPEVKLLDTGDVAQAWGGIASVQFGLPVMWTAAQDARGGSGDGAGLDVRGTGRPGRTAAQGPDRGRRGRRPGGVRRRTCRSS